MTDLHKLSPEAWAKQFNMTEGGYAASLQQIRNEMYDEAAQRVWAAMVNRYQITSAKQFDAAVATILRYIATHPKKVSYDEQMYEILLRFQENRV